MDYPRHAQISGLPGDRRLSVLAREKKRAAWSATIGAVVAGIFYASGTLAIHRADAELQEAVKACWASPTKDGHPIYKATDVKTFKEEEFVSDQVLKCSPEDFRSSEPVGEAEQKVQDLYSPKETRRDARNLDSLVVFVIFLLPLVWYFLLDRIREVSGAVTPRAAKQASQPDTFQQLARVSGRFSLAITSR